MRTKFGISGSVLKYLAAILMAVDHIGACIIEVYMLNVRMNAPSGTFFYPWWDQLLMADRVIRYIGRLAFPIYCFLLVEGFLHTRDVKKYAIRLGIFALISEVPFDLALHVSVWNPTWQNVYFTLLIGLLTIWFISREAHRPVLCAGVILAGMYLAELLHTDYGAVGVAAIVLLYVTRGKRGWQCAAGAICFVYEYTAPLAFIPVWMYNGERGKQRRWFFYWFYPVHLLVYAGIGYWLIPAMIK